MRIQAIETRYRGVYYRSRLEVKWRIVFDCLNIPCEYEMVGFDVNGVWYLPDFYMPHAAIHVEIKPVNIPDKENDRLQKLIKDWYSFDSEYGRLWVIRGNPCKDGYVIHMNDCQDSTAVFAMCRKCEGVSYIGDTCWGDIGKHTCKDHERPPIADDERLLNAYETAMRHRFEHKRPTHSDGSNPTKSVDSAAMGAVDWDEVEAKEGAV